MSETNPARQATIVAQWFSEHEAFNKGLRRPGLDYSLSIAAHSLGRVTRDLVTIAAHRRVDSTALCDLLALLNDIRPDSRLLHDLATRHKTLPDHLRRAFAVATKIETAVAIARRAATTTQAQLKESVRLPDAGLFAQGAVRLCRQAQSALLFWQHRDYHPDWRALKARVPKHLYKRESALHDSLASVSEKLSRAKQEQPENESVVAAARNVVERVKAIALRASVSRAEAENRLMAQWEQQQAGGFAEQQDAFAVAFPQYEIALAGQNQGVQRFGSYWEGNSACDVLRQVAATVARGFDLGPENSERAWLVTRFDTLDMTNLGTRVCQEVGRLASSTATAAGMTTADDAETAAERIAERVAQKLPAVAQRLAVAESPAAETATADQTPPAQPAGSTLLNEQCAPAATGAAGANSAASGERKPLQRDGKDGICVPYATLLSVARVIQRKKGDGARLEKGDKVPRREALSELPKEIAEDPNKLKKARDALTRGDSLEPVWIERDPRGQWVILTEQGAIEGTDVVSREQRWEQNRATLRGKPKQGEQATS